VRSLSDKVRIDGQRSAQHYVHTQGNSDPMDKHHLGKHATAPKTTHFKDPGPVPTGGSGGSGIEVDVEALKTALTQLQIRQTEFTETVSGSSSLTDHLPNGTGPTAEMMGQLYQHRVGDGGGVQYALQTHLAHLDTIVGNLDATITNYTSSEDQALTGVQGVAQPLSAAVPTGTPAAPASAPAEGGAS
jgi:hypothetical protein